MTVTRAEIPTNSVAYAFMLEPGDGLHPPEGLHADVVPGAGRRPGRSSRSRG